MSNFTNTMFDHMHPSLVIVSLDKNGRIYVFWNPTELCIIVFGSFVISFSLLLHLLVMESYIMHRAPLILMVLIKTYFWNHPSMTLCIPAKTICLGIRSCPQPKHKGVITFLIISLIYWGTCQFYLV